VRRLLILVVIAAGLGPPAAARQQAPSDRDDGWRSDVASFAREFPAAQRDFAKLYPRARFDADIAAITASIPTSTDGDLVLALMRLVAGAHVGHTYVRFPTEGPLAFHRLPIGVQWFADGLAVTAATEPYREAIGLRVVAIGSRTADELESSAAAYIAYENDGWLHERSRSLLLSAELLKTLGQVDADGRVRITLARPDGTTTAPSLAPVPWSDHARLVTILEARGLPVGPAQKQPSRIYRYEVLPDAKALYIRYSRCADDPELPFAAFVRDMFAAVDRDPAAVSRVVIDLRTNGGGNSQIIDPLIAGLRKRPGLSARGRLYVLVSPATFSSGLLAAITLKRDLKAILVGQPPGEKPNSYGEVRQLTLPRSGLVVQYSTKYFRLAGNAADVAAYDPDIQVVRTIADLLTGRDAALEAAISIPNPHP
jgi:hypothetical protein